MPEPDISVAGWDVAAHPRLVILYLNQHGETQAVRLTADQAAGIGMRLTQAAWVADNGVCTQPGSVAGIDQVLDEFDAARSRMPEVSR